MKLNIYSIFDQASGLYSRPFFTQSDGEAVRSFTDLATDGKHPVGIHPEDYTLYRLGIFQDTDGRFFDEDNSMLATALELCAAARNVSKDNLDLFDKKITNEQMLKTVSEGLKESVEDGGAVGPGMSFGGTD